MSEPTPINKIDVVLNFFATNKIADKYMPYIMLLNCFKLETNELTMILNKLIKDGYVVNETLTKNGETSQGYRITFEGLLFNEQGGYGQQMIRYHAENIRMETLEHSQRINANRMTYLTILIAVGTLVAAIYYSIEVWKFFHSQ